MARYAYLGVARAANGVLVPSGTISVYLAGTATLASIYTASVGGVAVNSVTTDAWGVFKFWVDEADYANSQKFKLTLTTTNPVLYSNPADDIQIFPASAAMSRIDSVAGKYVNDLFDGGYDVPIKPSKIFGGASNTVGHTIPNLADSSFVVKSEWGFINPVDYTTFALAITAATATSQSLIITTNITIAGTVSIPSNVPVMVIGGGKFTYSAGGSLSILGSFTAPQSQVFSGFTSVAFGNSSVREIRAEWFGLVADGSTDNSSALAAAIASAQNGTHPIPIKLPPGQINYSTGITLNAGNAQYMIFEGSGGGVYDPGAGNPTHGTVLTYTGTGIGITIQARGTQCRDFHLVAGNVNATAGIRIGNGIDIADLLFENMTIAGFSGTACVGIDVQAGRAITRVTFRNVCWNNNYHGLKLDNNAVVSLTTWTFYDCTWVGNSHVGFETNSAIGFTFYNPIFQSNGGSAFAVYGTATLIPTSISLYNPYFENNNASVAGYPIDIVGNGVGTEVLAVTFNNSTISGQGASATKTIRVGNTKNVSFDRPWFTGGVNPTVDTTGVGNNTNFFFGGLISGTITGSKTFGTVYGPVLSDTWVNCVWVASTTVGCQASAYSDSAAVPLTLVDRGVSAGNAAGDSGCVKFFVQKGNYYKVTSDSGAPTITLYTEQQIRG